MYDLDVGQVSARVGACRHFDENALSLLAYFTGRVLTSALCPLYLQHETFMFFPTFFGFVFAVFASHLQSRGGMADKALEHTFTVPCVLPLPPFLESTEYI